MATERGRRRTARLIAALPVMLALAQPSSARADQAWWNPLAFGGERVDRVTAVAGEIAVDTDSAHYVSTDGGRTFQRTGGAIRPPAQVVSGGAVWEIRAGTVLTGPFGQPLARDPAAPFLGTSAHLLAAPAALPGVVVAVGIDDHVWRRAASGGWATSFILLPAGGLWGAPHPTSLSAFTEPLSAAVYMATDGYGVLLSDDGGDDWIRADPGLPRNVLDLAADPKAGALFAATDDGLFVHHLQAFPAPPAYRDADLYLRWLGIAVVAMFSAMLAILGFRLTLPPAPR